MGKILMVSWFILAVVIVISNLSEPHRVFLVSLLFSVTGTLTGLYLACVEILCLDRDSIKEGCQSGTSENKITKG